MTKPIFRSMAITVFAMLISANSFAAVVYSSLAGADGGWCMSNNTSVASGFHTPAGAAHRLDSIRVRLQDTHEPGDAFSFVLYADNSGQPGALIAAIGSGNANGLNTIDIYTLTPASPIPLAADTTYWIVASTTGTTSCTLSWSNGTNPAGGIFAYAGEGLIISGAWNPTSPDYPQTEISATSLASSAAAQVPTLSEWGLVILSSLLASAAVIGFHRRRS